MQSVVSMQVGFCLCLNLAIDEVRHTWVCLFNLKIPTSQPASSFGIRFYILLIHLCVHIH